MPDTRIACNVVLLPDKPLNSKVTAASGNLTQYGSLFVLEEGKYYPHLSLYMLQINNEDIESAMKILAELADSTLTFHLKTRRYNNAERFIDIEYLKTPEIELLQTKLLKALNPLRHGLRDNDKVRMAEATGTVKRNLETYGYKAVGKLFRPHLTISRLKSENGNVLNYLDDAKMYHGSFSKLGIFEMGENGTCVRKLGEFELVSQEKSHGK